MHSIGYNLKTGLTVLITLLSVIFLTANAQRNCGMEEYLVIEYAQDPAIDTNRKAIEEHTQRYVQKGPNLRNESITIPVVVHVVYHSDVENLSIEQISSQIEALNRDFNNDPNSHWAQATNMKINFVLANADPQGQPSDGITRTYTSKTSFSVNQDVKYNGSGGKNAWPSDQYLNLWVCDLVGGYLGFAQYPGGFSSTDGVVIDYKYFGTIGTATFPYDEGKTATHEVGHWLNLDHIWGDVGCDKDDSVEDTPTAEAPNFGCSPGHYSCGSTDMVENFMDYSDDACMNIFTEGQKARAYALFSEGGFRHSFAKNIESPTDTTSDDSCKGKMVSIEILLDKYPKETSWEVLNNNEIVLAGGSYDQSLKSTLIIEENCLPGGCYSFKIKDTYADGICCKYGSGNYKVFVDGKLMFEGGEFKKEANHEFCIENNEGDLNADEDETDEDNTVLHCEDGIQNEDEIGVDCGGLECEPCIENAVILNEGFFESGMDGWFDGGSDCSRYFGSYSYENNYSIRLRDDSGLASSMISPELDLEVFTAASISFKMYANSMEAGESFSVQTLIDNEWIEIAYLSQGEDFLNDIFYEVSIPYPINSLKGQFKIECKGNSNGDQVYIDAVIIKGYNYLSNFETTITRIDYPREVPAKIESSEIDVNVFPNPAIDKIRIESLDEIKNVKIYTYSGVLKREIIVNNFNCEILLNEMPKGAYLLLIEGVEEVTSKRLIVN